MLICPECGEGIADSDPIECASCKWRGERREGVPVYLSQRDLADPVLREYLENYDRIAADDVVKSIQDEQYVEYQAHNLADVVGRLEGLNVCDVGCGKGFLAKALLARAPRELTVVDIAITYLRRLEIRDRVRSVIANAENLPFRATFDVIVTTDVMEHVLNVGSFLYSVNRALKPDGKVYIRVPFRESLLGYSPFLGCPYRFVHLRSFDKDILTTYLDDAGFRVERFHFDGFWLDIPWQLWKRGVVRRRIFSAFTRLVRRGLKSAVEITRWRYWPVRLFLRPVEITVVAQKTRELEKPPSRE